MGNIFMSGRWTAHWAAAREALSGMSYLDIEILEVERLA
jgi:hypothetical protein